MSQQLLCNKRTELLMKKKKQLNNKVTPKDIFDAVWPDGFVANVLYGLVDEEYQNSGIDKNVSNQYMFCAQNVTGTYLPQASHSIPTRPPTFPHALENTSMI
jgi:hypothetical protein